MHKFAGWLPIGLALFACQAQPELDLQRTEPAVAPTNASAPDAPISAVAAAATVGVNRCGESYCPDTFQCGGDFCTGDTSRTLVFNLQTVRVRGHLTVNGKVPAPSKCKWLYVRFADGAGVGAMGKVDCEHGYRFDLPVYVGTHRLEVRNDASWEPGTGVPLPRGSYVVKQPLLVARDRDDLLIDLPVVEASGTVESRPGGPVPDYVDLSCEDATSRSSVFIDFGGSSADFRGPAYPGRCHASISVRSTNGWQTVAAGSAELSAAAAPLRFNLAWVHVSGQLLVNGALPTATQCWSNEPKERVVAYALFEPMDHLGDFKSSVEVVIPCAPYANAWTYDVWLRPGRYRVSVRSGWGRGYGIVPEGKTVVADDVDLTADATQNLAMEVARVKGSLVDADGQPLCNLPVMFHSGLSFASVDVDCWTNTFEATVLRGAHDVVLHAARGPMAWWSNIPLGHVEIGATNEPLELKQPAPITLTGRMASRASLEALCGAFAKTLLVSDGGGVAGSIVAACDGSDRLTALLLRRGRFTAAAVLPDSTSVRVTAPGGVVDLTGERFVLDAEIAPRPVHTYSVHFLVNGVDAPDVCAESRIAGSFDPSRNEYLSCEAGWPTTVARREGQPLGEVRTSDWNGGSVWLPPVKAR